MTHANSRGFLAESAHTRRKGTYARVRVDWVMTIGRKKCGNALCQTEQWTQAKKCSACGFDFYANGKTPSPNRAKPKERTEDETPIVENVKEPTTEPAPEPQVLRPRVVGDIRYLKTKSAQIADKWFGEPSPPDKAQIVYAGAGGPPCPIEFWMLTDREALYKWAGACRRVGYSLNPAQHYTIDCLMAWIRQVYSICFETAEAGRLFAEGLPPNSTSES